MLDLSVIEHAIEDFADPVVDDVEREAHTRVGLVLTSAAHELVALLPDGPDAEAIVGLLVDAATKAHAIVHAHAAATPAVTAAPAATEAAAPAAPEAAPAAPAEPAAPAAPEATATPAAPTEAAPAAPAPVAPATPTPDGQGNIDATPPTTPTA